MYLFNLVTFKETKFIKAKVQFWYIAETNKSVMGFVYEIEFYEF